MKPVLFLCLLVATAADAEPSYRIREVRFAGDPGFAPDALRKVLAHHPRYDAAAVETDVARLHAFYLSQGYLDATIALGGVTFDGSEATITLDVRSGPKAWIRHVKIVGLAGEREKIITASNGDFPRDALCKCLFDATRDAEMQGRIDFTAELDVVHGNPVDVTVRVRPGTAHVVGRINFSGHTRISESTVRRMMVLQEHAVFDVSKLRRSLTRLNRSGLFEPLTMDDVEIQRHADGVT